MRACACDTASRLCVRTVLCSSALLLVPSSPSTNSAVDRSALFAGFAGTIDESDFFAAASGLPDAVLGTVSPGRNEDLPVPAQEMYVHAQGLKTTQVAKVLAMTDPYLLPSACHDGIGTPG
jgi:hypothetical protein